MLLDARDLPVSRTRSGPRRAGDESTYAAVDRISEQLGLPTEVVHADLMMLIDLAYREGR